MHCTTPALDHNVAPLVVTQVTSELVCGIPARRWRQWVPRSGLPYARIGQLVAVDASELHRWLTEHAARAPDVADDADEADKPATGVEAIRRRAGLRLAGGGR